MKENAEDLTYLDTIKRNFKIGDIIKYSNAGHFKFGKIVGFVHPDEIFSIHMKKDLMEKTFSVHRNIK